jgi:hypothetical protein
MAKKSRRVRKQQARFSQAQMVRPAASEAARFSVAAPASPASAPVDLGEEYRYVIADLKRIGILAVAMLAVLIVLAFLLT